MCAWVSTTASIESGATGEGSPVAEPELLHSLEQAGVDEDPPAGRLHEEARPGDGAGRAEEADGRHGPSILQCGAGEGGRSGGGIMRRKIRVVGAMIEKDGRYLITQRSPTASLPLLWEFPGGRVEAGETDEAALARELEEEMDISVRVGRAGHPRRARLRQLRHRFLRLPLRDPGRGGPERAGARPPLGPARGARPVRVPGGRREDGREAPGAVVARGPEPLSN